MINFVLTLPPVLEPNSIYYVQGAGGNAQHFVSDDSGNPIKVSTEDLVQAYMANLKGTANGYAELDGSGTIPETQLPAGSSPGDISGAISAVQSTLQSNIDQKADTASVYTQLQVDALESGLQTQIDAKQASLSNADDVAKIGDATFDGKPLVLVSTIEW